MDILKSFVYRKNFFLRLGFTVVLAKFYEKIPKEFEKYLYFLIMQKAFENYLL